ncbi:MAG: dolichyl-phosphate beta-glucosyltransferase [Planctomycetota bacterium]
MQNCEGTEFSESRRPRHTLRLFVDGYSMPYTPDNEQVMGDDGPANSLAFSLIIPAYNEAERLPPYLDEIRKYMGQHYQTDYEVIVVDDGSSDQLVDVLAELSATWPQLRTVRHGRNLGKGAAVRTGVLAARGARVLYADADGATPIDQEPRLREAIENGADVVVGSRLIYDKRVERKRRWHRALIGRAFASAARLVLGLQVRDTQCGFKMLRAGPAKHLFRLSQEKGYLFDLEILVLAQRCGYSVIEVPINWADQPGSRLQMRRECCRICADLWRVRRQAGRKPPKEGLEEKPSSSQAEP